MTDHMPSKPWRAAKIVTLIGLLSVVIALFFLFDWWPPLRGGFGWRWPYEKPNVAHLLRLVPGFLALITYGAGVHLLRRRHSWYYLGWCAAGATIIPITLLAWNGDPLQQLFLRTVSGMVTGGFATAVRIETLHETLSQWPTLMPSLESISRHVSISPPGWPALYFLVSQAFAAVPALAEPLSMILRPMQCDNIPLMSLSNAKLASAWLGITSSFWAALTTIPLYAIGRRLSTEQVARLAVAWWPLVPSVTLFLGTLNTPSPLVATTIFWLAWVGLTDTQRSRSVVSLMLSGGLTAAAVLLGFVYVPILLFCGILILMLWQREPSRPILLTLRWPFLMGLQYGLGLILVFTFYTLYTDHTILQLLAASMKYHLQLDRPYWPWLLLHTWDFAIFVGLPVFGLAIIALLGWCRGFVRQLVTALALTLAVLIISGSARGETGRIWLFFMPLTVLAAAAVLGELKSSHRRLLVTAQIVWFLVILLVLPTVSSELTTPPPYDQIAFVTEDANPIPVGGHFGDVLDLRGYWTYYEKGTGELSIFLNWKALRQMDVPYYFSILPVSAEGQTLSAIDWQPFEVQFPTTCWHMVNAPLTDRVKLSMDPLLSSQEWWLSLSVFELSRQNEPKRLPFYSAEGLVDDQVGLGPIRLAAAE